MIADVLNVSWKAEAYITTVDDEHITINMVSPSFDALVESKEEIVKEYSLMAQTIKFANTRKEMVYKMEMTIDEEVEL